MPNERLRATLLERGLTPTALGDEVGVDHKTVERWISGRVPYRRHRYAVASRLGVDEAYLWPGALSREQVAAASDSEVLAIYAHRSDVPHDAWAQLFKTAENDIGVLVYSGLFLAEDAAAKKAAKIRNAMVLYRALRDTEGVEFRFHKTVLYTSIYRSDDQLLVNTHVFGMPAALAPVWHLRRLAGGEIAATYLDSFERVWDTAVPLPG